MGKSDQNIEKLAREVIDSWDMNTLQSYALDRLVEAYEENEELFKDDVNLMKGE